MPASEGVRASSAAPTPFCSRDSLRGNGRNLDPAGTAGRQIPQSDANCDGSDTDDQLDSTGGIRHVIAQKG